MIEAENPGMWSEFKSNDVDAMIDELVRLKKRQYPDGHRPIPRSAAFPISLGVHHEGCFPRILGESLPLRSTTRQWTKTPRNLPWSTALTAPGASAPRTRRSAKEPAPLTPPSNPKPST